MKLIFTIHHPFEDIISIDIYSPARGINGTLSYAVKIDGLLVFFEINDEGDWAITSDHIIHSPDALNLIGTAIFNEEQKRLKEIYALNEASVII